MGRGKEVTFVVISYAKADPHEGPYCRCLTDHHDGHFEMRACEDGTSIVEHIARCPFKDATHHVFSSWEGAQQLARNFRVEKLCENGAKISVPTTSLESDSETLPFLSMLVRRVNFLHAKLQREAQDKLEKQREADERHFAQKRAEAERAEYERLRKKFEES